MTRHWCHGAVRGMPAHTRLPAHPGEACSVQEGNTKMGLQKKLVQCKPPVVVQLVLLALHVATLSTSVRGQSSSPSWDNCYGRHCQVGEYCGTNKPFQSCRRCTNIAGWCNDTRYVEENFFPCLQTCKLIVAEGKRFELENKTRSLEAELSKAGTTTIILKIIIGCEAALALIAVVDVVACSVRGRQRCCNSGDPQQTARASRPLSRLARCLCDKLALWVRCPARGVRKPVRATSNMYSASGSTTSL